MVLSNYLRINYTKEYIKSLTNLTTIQSKRVLYWLGKMYDEHEGINTKTIRKIAEGVQSGLL
jgi:phage-related protein